MPVESYEMKSNRWRSKNPKLKTILTITIPLVVLLIIILLAVFLLSKRDICTTFACIEESTTLINNMNTDVNPCDNFYQFACGKALKDPERKIRSVEAEKQKQHRLLKFYKEPVKSDDHKVTKIAKRMFQECMNEEEIENDNLITIKGVIQDVGGWPVLDRYQTSNFNWLEATWKLRELGYPFGMFLDVKVARNRKHTDRYSLEVVKGDVDYLHEIRNKYTRNDANILRNYSTKKAIEIMTKVARHFGADDEAYPAHEMNAVLEFWQRLKHGYVSVKECTISEYQSEYEQRGRTKFDWLEFLNRIIAPQPKLSLNDTVTFIEVGEMSKWIDLISNTPKRIVGNYMIWRLLETQIPYLTKDLRSIANYKLNETRDIFCLVQCETRFPISPMEVLHLREVFPIEKKQEFDKIYSNIKYEFLRNLEKADWMEKKDRAYLREKVNSVTVVPGLPGDYISDSLLNELDVDLVALWSDSFLNCVAQINRNYQTILYKQIYLSPPNNTLNKFYLVRNIPFPIYKLYENELFIPFSTLYDLEKETPQYSKYPYVGVSLATFLIAAVTDVDYELFMVENHITNKTKRGAIEIGECIEKQMKNYTIPRTIFWKELSLGASASRKISYEAYEKWIQTNGEEQKLPGLDYTPRQLFWIIAADCRIADPAVESGEIRSIDTISKVTLSYVLNNADFSKDFNCPTGSPANPPEKCRLLL